MAVSPFLFLVISRFWISALEICIIPFNLVVHSFIHVFHFDITWVGIGNSLIGVMVGPWMKQSQSKQDDDDEWMDR